MTKPLIFYTNPMSRGRIARWMLEEVLRALLDERVSIQCSKPTVTDCTRATPGNMRPKLTTV